jgi:hypothetical protein
MPFNHNTVLLYLVFVAVTVLSVVLVVAMSKQESFGHRFRQKRLRRRWAKEAARTRARNERRRHYRLLRKFFEPFTSGAPQAVGYIIGILIVSIAAPALVLLLTPHAGCDAHQCFYRDGALGAEIALISGLVVAFLVSALRGRRIALAERVLAALKGSIEPDGPGGPDIVPIVPPDKYWHDGTRTRFDNIDEGSSEAPEWVVALRQTGGPYQGRHTLDSLKRQIKQFNERLEGIQKERAEEARYTGKLRPVPAIKWVCFVSKTNRFHALQSYEVFLDQIIVKENVAYLHILNADSEAAFWQEIQKHMINSAEKTHQGEPINYPNAIPGLECFWVGAGMTREAVLRILAKHGKARAMLVNARTEGKALGVVSWSEVIQKVLLQHLDQLDLKGGDADDSRYGKTPPWWAPPK